MDDPSAQVQVDEVLRLLGGVATAAQLMQHVSRRRLDLAVASGRVLRLSRGRYGLPEVEQGKAAALRLSGAMCLTTAALGFGWPVAPPREPHVVVPRHRRVAPARRRGVSVHWWDVEVDGITTTPERTVVDCIRHLPLLDAVCVGDSALRLRSVTRAGLVRAAERAPRNGRARALSVIDFLDGRAENPFESATRVLGAQVPGLRLQPQLFLPGYGRPDLRDERLGLLVECDSYAFHASRGALLSDIERYNRAAPLGQAVLRFGWEHVFLQPEYVVATLTEWVAWRNCNEGQATRCPAPAVPPEGTARMPELHVLPRLVTVGGVRCGGGMRHFLPAYLLDRVAETADDRATACARQTLLVDARLRERRRLARQAVTAGVPWVVHDAGNGTELPGTRVRAAGEPESGDVAVDEAAAGLTATQALLADWGRDSYDGAGATATATVHYGQDYVNAFWDGTQLALGDGDGEVFERFTKPLEVLAHELAHALIQFTADLTYEGQSGALNESVADVVGACVRQRLLGQDALQADWLIGVGLFLPGVRARALRSMVEPGTAYDDPRLGRDPQPGHMDDYVETTDDHGGVHINSGIPNRAFVLAAQAIGGQTWQGAGRIWCDTLLSGIDPGSDFATFAAATVAQAGDHADAVAQAWRGVGLEPDRAATTRQPAPATSTTVEVRRSGGVTGMVRAGEVDLASGDPRASEVRSLVEGIDFQGVASASPAGADRFVYAFHYGAVEVHVSEQELTDDLRALARIVLDE